MGTTRVGHSRIHKLLLQWGAVQRIIDRLLLSELTGAVAQVFDLSPGRVAQLRRHFHADWLRFGAAPGEEPSTTALL
jgi:hypothetical protein